jgi:hypothetical protein
MRALNAFLTVAGFAAIIVLIAVSSAIVTATLHKALAASHAVSAQG